jgi:hypothetical protein
VRCIVVALQLALYVTGLFVLSAGVSVLAVHHFLNPEGGGGASADTGADTGADGGGARATATSSGPKMTRASASSSSAAGGAAGAAAPGAERVTLPDMGVEADREFA